MNIDELERAVCLHRRLKERREMILGWASLSSPGTSGQIICSGAGFSSAPEIELTAESAARVADEIVRTLKNEIEEIEGQLAALGVEFEYQQYFIAPLTIGRATAN